MKSKVQNTVLDQMFLAYESSLVHPTEKLNLSREDEEAIRAMDTDELFRVMAHPPEKMFVSITFAGRKLTVANLSAISTNYGLCYQMNDGHAGMDLLRSHIPGRSMGLSLILNLQQEEYYYTIGHRYYTGFVIQLLDQEEVSSVTEVGFAVAPGTDNFVAITAEDVINIEPPCGACGETQLKNYKSYSQTKCLEECAVETAVKKRGCKPAHHKGDVKTCDPIESIYLFQDMKEESFLREMMATCTCPINCKSRTFPHTLSYSKYPSDFRIKTLQKLVQPLVPYDGNTSKHLEPVSEEYIRTNLVAVDIFFSSITVTVVTQHDAYPSFNLICDIGGALGLLLGGSLLTLGELTDLFGTSYFTAKAEHSGKKKRRRKNNKKKIPQSQTMLSTTT